MAVIKFVDRKGKDLFQFMLLAVQDESRANEWAATNYVLIDGSPLELQQYLKLNPVYRDKIIGSIFNMKTSDNYESDDTGIIYYDDIADKTYTIAKRKVKHSLLVEIQTIFQNTNSNKRKYIYAMKEALTRMFDVTIAELDEYPYPLVAGMVTELNFFLTESTKITGSFTANDDDLFTS